MVVGPDCRGPGRRWYHGFPSATAIRDKAELRIIIDPIDGTRGLMYQKRAAWILTGVAVNRGPEQTNISDIELPIQTEIPLVKQHLSDSFWAIKGSSRWRALQSYSQESASGSNRNHHRHRASLKAMAGLRAFSRRTRELAAIDDTVVEQLLGPGQRRPGPGVRRSIYQ